MAYLECKHISKHFPGVRALNDVSLVFDTSSIHGVCGENGAGKSTLLKILSGAHVPSSGTICIDNTTQHFSTPVDAITKGIAVIYQELNLIQELSVAENMLLGKLPVSRGIVSHKTLHAIAQAQLSALGETINTHTKVKDLPIAQRQMVEIGKALLRESKIIAFDEPTSSLSEKETHYLFSTIRTLKQKGCVIIYVSHRLEEIFELCDTISVLRDGAKVVTTPVHATSPQQIIKSMVGRPIQDIYGHRPRSIGSSVLRITSLLGHGLNTPVSFSVHKGEILGFFGLIGSGRTELMKLIYGASPIQQGTVSMHNDVLHIKHPCQAITKGIAFCSEDRKQEGIIPMQSVADNININARRHFLTAGLFINKHKELEHAQKHIATMSIVTPSPKQLIKNLSGGNQQKALLSRWFSEHITLFILDEPTRGIDVGAKNEIYQIMYTLAEQGSTIIMVSSELPEIIGVSDRIVVMREGSIAGILPRNEATQEAVLHLALPQDTSKGAIPA